MSAPRVWWSPEKKRVYRSVRVLNGPSPRTVDLGYWEDFVDVPDDAVELVPQASRDELREAIKARVRAELDAYMGHVPGVMTDITDAVMDVLAERGLVASPETGEGEPWTV